MDVVRTLARTIKDEFYDEAEILVRNCTKNDDSISAPNLMKEVSMATYDVGKVPLVLSILWQRMYHYPYYYHVSKSVKLLEYLLKHAHDQFVQAIVDRKAEIARLQKYEYINDNTVEIAEDVRKTASRILELLENPKKLEEARKNARLSFTSYSYKDTFLGGRDSKDIKDIGSDSNTKQQPIDSEVTEDTVKTRTKPKKIKEKKHHTKQEIVPQNNFPQKKVPAENPPGKKNEKISFDMLSPDFTNSNTNTDLLTGDINDIPNKPDHSRSWVDDFDLAISKSDETKDESLFDSPPEDFLSDNVVNSTNTISSQPLPLPTKQVNSVESFDPWNTNLVTFDSK